jgi:uncharacterized protein YdhG (YjbR/CyaY superfamily)
MAKTNFKSVNEYVASKSAEVQRVLKAVRSTIRKALPQAEEAISYQIPTYRLNGVPVLYFAGWKEHYSLYPVGSALLAEFKDELDSYEVAKGTIRFPLSEPVPLKLIARIAKFRAKQLSVRDKGKNARKNGRDAQLQRVRRICAAIPNVAEKLSHGMPSFFVEKDKGVFTMLADNHHDDGRLAVWLPVKEGLQSALIEDAPAMYFKPPYVGAGGWIGIRLDRVSDETLDIHVRQAWELIARKTK